MQPRQVKTQHKTQQPVCRSLGTSNDNTCFKWPAWSRRTFNSKPTRRTGTCYKKLQHPILHCMQKKVIHSKTMTQVRSVMCMLFFCCCCISSPTMLLSFPLPVSRESPLNLSPRRGATKRVETWTPRRGFRVAVVGRRPGSFKRGSPCAVHRVHRCAPHAAAAPALTFAFAGVALSYAVSQGCAQHAGGREGERGMATPPVAVSQGTLGRYTPTQRESERGGGGGGGRVWQQGSLGTPGSFPPRCRVRTGLLRTAEAFHLFLSRYVGCP